MNSRRCSVDCVIVRGGGFAPTAWSPRLAGVNGHIHG